MSEIKLLPKEAKLLDLYKQIHLERKTEQKAEYDNLLAELERMGYSVEQGYGWYLHTPDGKTLVLDSWNEKSGKSAKKEAKNGKI